MKNCYPEEFAACFTSQLRNSFYQYAKAKITYKTHWFSLLFRGTLVLPIVFHRNEELINPTTPQIIYLYVYI